MTAPQNPPPGLAELQEHQTERRIEEERLRRAHTFTRMLLWVAVAWAISFSVILVYAVVQIRHTQIDGTPNGKKLVAASTRILDCTKTKGKCTVANQRKTARLVAGLVASGKQASADAAACSAQPGVSQITPVDRRADAILACMVTLQAARDDAHR
jgi:hypothetical protein